MGQGFGGTPNCTNIHTTLDTCPRYGAKSQESFSKKLHILCICMTGLAGIDSLGI